MPFWPSLTHLIRFCRDTVFNGLYTQHNIRKNLKGYRPCIVIDNHLFQAKRDIIGPNFAFTQIITFVYSCFCLPAVCFPGKCFLLLFKTWAVISSGGHDDLKRTDEQETLSFLVKLRLGLSSIVFIWKNIQVLTQMLHGNSFVKITKTLSFEAGWLRVEL